MPTKDAAVFQSLGKHWIRPKGHPAAVNAVAIPLGLPALKDRRFSSTGAIKMQVGLCLLYHHSISLSTNNLLVYLYARNTFVK